MGTRRTFKCKFSDRVTSDNRDGVVQSLINQFQGLGAEPEVTLDGDTFSVTLTISDNLTPTLVRDKLALNYFIDRVTTGDSIRKIQIMRLPKATTEVLGDGKGQLDGIARDTGVNEILTENTKDGEEVVPREKYTIGPNPPGIPEKKRKTVSVFGLGMSRGGSSWVKQADPGSLRNEGQAFTSLDDDIMGPEDLDSMATNVTKLPKVFATEQDAGGGGQFAQPFDKKTVMDSVNRAPQESRTPRVTVFNSGSSPARADGGPIPFNSWFSEVGSESTMPAEENAKGPLDFSIAASLKGEKTDSENVESTIELPEATQGGTVLGLEGWFSASLHFGYDNEAGHNEDEDDDDDEDD